MKLEISKIILPVQSVETIDVQQLQAIADSMEEIGQSHQIIVLPANEFGQHPLASGEKRVLAAKILGWTEIEAEIRDVDFIGGREIRLHENLKRFNLPWYEEVLLKEELHLIRQREHGVPERTGRPSKTEPPKPKVGWSLRDTAEELNVGLGPLSEDLALARALRNDPTLAKVTDKKTATKLIRAIATRVRSETEASMPGKIESNEIYCGDSAEILKRLPDFSINHCITDPPWIKYFDPALRLDERTLPVFKEVYRVMRNGGMLYVVCGLDDYAYYVGINEPNLEVESGVSHKPGELEKIGFTVSTTPAIWVKENYLTRRGIRPWEYARDFEFIIVACKGQASLTTSKQTSAIKTFPIVPPVKLSHPNEKPISLIQDLVVDCSYEGDIILDPFAGSGVVGSACTSTKRNYILIERDRDAFGKIVARMKS